MTVLNVKHVDAMASAFKEGLDLINTTADELKKTVEAARGTSDADECRKHMVVASALIGNGLTTAASTYAWHSAVTTALDLQFAAAKAETPEPVSIEDVSASLADDVVGMTSHLITPTGNPLSHVWKTLVAGAHASIVHRLEMLAQADNAVRSICERIGASFESFQDGDANTMRLVMEEALRTDQKTAEQAGVQLPPGLADMLAHVSGNAPAASGLPVG